MDKRPHNNLIVASLFCSVVLWGANNAGTKFLVKFWPPIFLGCSRFFGAALILLALFRWTPIFGQPAPISREVQKQLWWRGGVALALYIIAFNYALVLAPISHVAVYLGAAPVWALLWEGLPEKTWKSFQRYFAAALALIGVFVLFLPVLRGGTTQLLGEILALASSVLWTNYGRQCRALGQHLSGAQVSAHTFMRAAVLILPLTIYELYSKPLIWRTDLALIQLFCIVGSGVVAFALWNNALRHWKTSQVYLFNNLIPLSTMTWAHITLGEPVTPTFWTAIILIVTGVLIGQADWQKIFGRRWLPFE